MSTLFATLIGINAYPSNPLFGCVRDVLSMDLFLCDYVAQQKGLSYKPRYFLSPHQYDGNDISDHRSATPDGVFTYEAATFKGITENAFAHLKQAENGDICFFYYSGHGSQTGAPEVFWHSKSDRMNETLVCVDSRIAGRARDIVDKELAFLLWDCLKDKDVHCLVIMDCCHSGNNVRKTAAVDERLWRSRHEKPAGFILPLEDYLGYDQGFYTINDGIAAIPIARHVHLAASRDSENALELDGGGLFTSRLLELLRSGGTRKS